MNLATARPAALLLAAALTTACATSTARYPTAGSTAADEVQVQVSNNNWLDLTIYAVHGGSRVRLGTVTTGMTRTFKLPSIVNVYSAELRLEADPLGSARTFISSPIMVEPGAAVRWSLENQLALSSFTVVARR